MTDTPIQRSRAEVEAAAPETVLGWFREGALDDLLGVPGRRPKKPAVDPDDFIGRYLAGHAVDPDRQLGRDDLKAMSGAEIVAALDKGKLNDLLGVGR